MKSFNYLPNSVKYYNSESELFFDESYEISFIDWSHLVDHCERLPLEFLKLNLPDYDFDCKHDKKFFEDLSTFLKKKENSKYLNRLKGNYESAFNLAKKKVKWNFKVAVPIYFARKRIITLLLPLDLTQDGHIDAAVVLEAVSDKKLSIPHTIFSLKMAYLDSRLICRHDIQWLTSELMKGGEQEDDELELEFEQEQDEISEPPMGLNPEDYDTAPLPPDDTAPKCSKCKKFGNTSKEKCSQNKSINEPSAPEQQVNQRQNQKSHRFKQEKKLAPNNWDFSNAENRRIKALRSNNRKTH